MINGAARQCHAGTETHIADNLCILRRGITRESNITTDTDRRMNGITCEPPTDKPDLFGDRRDIMKIHALSPIDTRFNASSREVARYHTATSSNCPPRFSLLRIHQMRRAKSENTVNGAFGSKNPDALSRRCGCAHAPERLKVDETVRIHLKNDITDLIFMAFKHNRRFRTDIVDGIQIAVDIDRRLKADREQVSSGTEAHARRSASIRHRVHLGCADNRGTPACASQTMCKSARRGVPPSCESSHCRV